MNKTYSFQCRTCAAFIRFEGVKRIEAMRDAVGRGWVIGPKCRCPKCAKKEATR